MGRKVGDTNKYYFQGAKAEKQINLRVSEKLLRQFDEIASKNGQKRSEALFQAMLAYIKDN